MSQAASKPRVALFVTCLVDLMRPSVGFAALKLLERPGVVLSRAQLMQRAYRYDNLITERTIDTHVRRIRAKFTHYRGKNRNA